MKKIILATCSVLVITALAAAGCTRTPKQGKVLRVASSTGYQPEYRPTHCCLRGRPYDKKNGNYLMQPTHTTFDKALHAGASALTVRDYWRK